MKNKNRRSNLYVIAGPNGAGKTTFARKFLPEYVNCLEFVNADFIAYGLSPFDPERAAFRAGRILLEQIRLLADRGVDFGFETTLAGKTLLKLLQGMKRRRYRVPIFFYGSSMPNWPSNVSGSGSEMEAIQSQRPLSAVVTAEAYPIFSTCINR